MMTIEQWTIVNPFWEYTQIDTTKRCHLTGIWPGRSEYERDTSSPIVECDTVHLIVKTRSGSTYKLGTPLPQYQQWLEEKDLPLCTNTT